MRLEKYNTNTKTTYNINAENDDIPVFGNWMRQLQLSASQTYYISVTFDGCKNEGNIFKISFEGGYKERRTTKFLWKFTSEDLYNGQKRLKPIHVNEKQWITNI